MGPRSCASVHESNCRDASHDLHTQVLMSVIDDVPEDVELQEQRQEFLVTKIIVDEADEEIDLEDDEFIEIDEPKVYQSDPCLREDAGGGDEDDGPGGEKKEADAEE